MKNIKRVMAAEFSRELSAKVFAGSVRLTHRGFKMGGPTAYAFQRRLVDDQCRPKGILTIGQRKSLLTDHGEAAGGEREALPIGACHILAASRRVERLTGLGGELLAEIL